MHFFIVCRKDASGVFGFIFNFSIAFQIIAVPISPFPEKSFLKGGKGAMKVTICLYLKTYPSPHINSVRDT